MDIDRVYRMLGYEECDVVLQCVRPEPCEKCDPLMEHYGLVRGRYYRAVAVDRQGEGWVLKGFPNPVPHPVHGQVISLHCFPHFAEIEAGESVREMLERVRDGEEVPA